MRGALYERNPLEESIERLSDLRLGDEKIKVPNGTPSKALAWDFRGEVKFLDECSKEELLYVCQVLCQKLQPTNDSDSLPNAA